MDDNRIGPSGLGAYRRWVVHRIELRQRHVPGDRFHIWIGQPEPRHLQDRSWVIRVDPDIESTVVVPPP